MALIDFPNVPPIPGVPDLRRSTYGVLSQTGIMGKLQGLDVFGLLDGLDARRWLITDVNGKTVIEPDSVIGFEFRGESRLAGYPMEQGAFSTYNKVQMPYAARIRMTCGGNVAIAGLGGMSRDAFLTALEYLKASLDLVSIVTPDMTYPRLNLERFDYKREASNGVTLLTVEAMFSEVRETAGVAFSNTAMPSGQDPKSMSCLKPLDPTPAQIATADMSTIT